MFLFRRRDQGPALRFLIGGGALNSKLMCNENAPDGKSGALLRYGIYFTATHSISTSAFLGRQATWNAARAG